MRATAEKLIAAIREADETLDADQESEADVTLVLTRCRDALAAWAYDALSDMGSEATEAEFGNHWWDDSVIPAARVEAAKTKAANRQARIMRIYG